MNYLKDYRIWIVIALFAIGVAVGESARNTSLKSTQEIKVIPTITLVPTNTPEPTAMPTLAPRIDRATSDILKETYMKSCVSESKKTDYCECTWVELISKYSLSEILTMSNEYTQTGDVPDGMVSIAGKCLKYYK